MVGVAGATEPPTETPLIVTVKELGVPGAHWDGAVANAPLVIATAALAVRVSEVLLAIVATVPMAVPAEFLITAPMTRSVVKNVEVPVTVGELVVAVIVPLRVASEVRVV